MNHVAQAAITQLVVEINSKARTFVLRIPPAIRDLPLRMPADPVLDADRQAWRLGLIVAACVDSVDGGPFPRELRMAIQRDSRALRELLTARARLFDHYRHQGVCTLYCPHCNNGSLDVDILGLAIALNVDPWPIANADGIPADPFLVHLVIPAERTAAVPPARLAIAHLPSVRTNSQAQAKTARFGLAIDPELDAQGWLAWGRDHLPLLENKEHWTYANTGFRSLLRLALALETLDGITKVTPEHLETLPVTDVLFLDAVYALLRTVPVADLERATLRCQACGGNFLAVL